jgi:SNF2 family DNA or RNA helicase
MISPKPNPKDPDKVAREVQFYKTAVAEDESEVVELINDSNGAEKLCGKLKTLRVLLQRWYEQEKKVIVFSYSTRMLDLIEKLINPSFRGKFCRYVRKRSFFPLQWPICLQTLLRLDGTTKIDHRQSIIDMFNTSSQKQMFLFLISTKAGGLGLNITSATVACVIDPSWNVTHDLQAQDRIHRLGQTKACQIFRFVSSGTIEEIVYNRQVYKQQMANVSQKGNFEKRYYQVCIDQLLHIPQH